MKTVIVIRHAKAEEGTGSDIERKLTPRGHRDARRTAEMIKERGYKIDKIFASNSERTMETTQEIAAVLNITGNNIRYFESLYLADVVEIIETIDWLKENENISTLAIVGHNPGVTNFVNDTAGALLPGMPTSGVAVIDVAMDNWDNFQAAKKTLAATFSPKSDA